MQIKTLATLCLVSSFFVGNSWALQNEEDFMMENRGQIHCSMKVSGSLNDSSKLDEMSYFQTALDKGSKGIKYVISNPITFAIVGLFMQATMVAAGHGTSHG